MDGLFKVLFSRFCATKFNFFLILVAYFFTLSKQNLKVRTLFCYQISFFGTFGNTK